MTVMVLMLSLVQLPWFTPGPENTQMAIHALKKQNKTKKLKNCSNVYMSECVFFTKTLDLLY